MVLIRCCCRFRPSIVTTFRPNAPNTPSSALQPTRAVAQPSHIQRHKRTYATAPPATENPILDQYLAKKQRPKSSRKQETPQQPPQQGKLTSSSIFSSLDNAPRTVTFPNGTTIERNPISMATNLDPKPDDRRRWERRMVIHAIRRRGRLSRKDIIKRTERELLSKSQFWRTSVKKLAPLARQIAGKSIEDAITQMGFSKKKAAKEVQAHLVKAQINAVVTRGMGLGHAEGRTGSPVTVRLRDGSRHVVRDRTGMYVAEAWVGKGTYGRASLKRARGRRDLLLLPQTSISVLLKEEATRVREHEDRVKREKAKKPWNPLPDRPVTEQRPFYGW